MRWFVVLLGLGVGVASVHPLAAAELVETPASAIAPVEPALGRPVEFERDVFPILDAKCIACHNLAINENGLNLEDVKGILKGGKRGPSVIPQDPEKSLLYRMARRSVQPAMPPLPNKVEAAACTPKELGILRQWIVEGASAGAGGAERTIAWQPLPPGMHPIYAAATTFDGQWAACGRGNQVLVFHVPTGELAAQLADPELKDIQFNGRPMYAPGSAHRDFVHSLALSPDGNMVASGSFREVKLWSRPAPSRVFELAAEQGAVTAVAASRDEKWLATAGQDHVIRVWQRADGKRGPTFAGHTATVTGLQFTADSNRLLSCSADQSLRVWELATGTPGPRVNVPSPLNGLTITADGARVVTAGADKLLRVWELAAISSPQQLAAPVAATAIRTSPDKKWIAIGEADGKITLIESATRAAQPLVGHAGPVTGLAFSHGSARLVSGGADKTVRVWDLASKQPVALLTGGDSVGSVALSPNGQQALSGTSRGQIQVWKLDVPEPRLLPHEGHGPAMVAALSPDGKTGAIAGQSNGKPAIIIRDLTNGNAKVLPGHDGAISALAFNGDGTRIVSGSADKTARVWSIPESKELARFEGHAQPITAVAFRPDGQQAASASSDQSLKIWNAADAKEVAACAGHSAAISALAYSPNGQALLSASADQTVRQWNAGNGQQTASIDCQQPVTALALSSDGQRFAVAGTDASVKVFQWDGKPVFKLDGHTAPVKRVAFSPDQSRLVTAGTDNQACVWDLATGLLLESLPLSGELLLVGLTGPNQLISASTERWVMQGVHAERQLPGHAKEVTGLAYNQGGDLAYTASQDGTLRRFQIGSGQQQFSQNHGAPIRDLAVSPDFAFLATAGENNQTRIWNAGDGGPGPKPVLEGFTAPAQCVAFSGDGQYIASGTTNNLVLVHHVKTGTLVQIDTGHGGPVSGITAGDAQRLFFSTAADNVARSWMVAAGPQLAGHNGSVTSVAANPSAASQVVSGSDDGSVRLWDLGSGNAMRNYNHGVAVTAVAVRLDGQRLASTSTNHTLKLWNIDGQQVSEMKGDWRAQRLVTDMTADEAEAKTLAAAAKDGVQAAEKLSTDRSETAKKAQEAIAAADKAAKEAAEKAKSAAQAAEAEKAKSEEKKDDQNLAKSAADLAKAATEAQAAAQKATDDHKRAIEVASLSDKAAQEALAGIGQAKTQAEAAAQRQVQAEAALAAAKTAAAEKERPLRAVCFSPDGKELASASEAGSVGWWDATTGVPLDSLDARAGTISALTFVDRRFLLTGGQAQAAAWDLSPAWSLAGVLGPPAENPQDLSHSRFVSRVLAVAFSPDGKLLATGGGEPSRSGELMIWDIAERKLVKTLPDAHSDTIFGVQFSRDGKSLLSGGADKFVKIFNVENGQHVKSFEGHTNHVLGVAWRSDGQRIASAGADNVVKIWKVAEGEQERTIQGYSKQVTCVRYIGRGNNLASCGGDKTVRFHQGDNGNNFRTFGGSPDFLFAVSVSDNEQLVIAGGQDGALRVWNGANGQMLKTLEVPKPPADGQQAQAR